MDCYRDLIVWKESKLLAVAVYQATELFPKEEMYGLSSQIRKSAVSVPSNIAEGSGRRTTSDFLNFLHIARGSLFELQTQFDIAKKLNFIDSKRFKSIADQINEIERMLNSFIQKLKSKL